MADQCWGKCKGCRFFDSHQASADEATVARCSQPELADFDLQVSSDSGCNAFEARVGLSERMTLDMEPAPGIH